MLDKWRQKVGNFLIWNLIGSGISLTVMIGLTLLVYYCKIPNPAIILLTGQIVATILFGAIPGAICGLETIAYCMFFFSKNNSFFIFEGNGLYKIIIIVICVITCATLVGFLSFVSTKYKRRLSDLNGELKIENANLFKMTSTDSLTGLKNRYGFGKDYDSYFNKDVFLMVIDIDNFKRINDRYGHGSGDLALKCIGDLLQEVFGAEYCYRYGGDEFVVINEVTTKIEFEEKISTLSKKLEANKNNNLKFEIHFSAGYVNGLISEDDDLKLMLNLADVFMYEAKNKGKNQFIGKPFNREQAKAVLKK